MRYTAILVLALCGCPSPNTYATARTLEPHRLQLVVAPEANGGHDVAHSGGAYDEWSPLFPTVGARYGVVDNFDIGVRAPHLTSIATDAKLMLLSGRFDLAFDPGVEWYRGWRAQMDANGLTTEQATGEIVHLHVPMMINCNLGRSITVVASPGLIVQADRLNGGLDTALIGKLGIGLNLRAGRRFALQPEFSVMQSFGDAAGNVGIIAGIGFVFGSQPRFDDVGALSPVEAPVVGRR